MPSLEATVNIDSAKSTRDGIINEAMERLVEHLPLESPREFVECIEYLELAGEQIPMRTLERHIPADPFPIRTADDLRDFLEGAADRAISLSSSGSFPGRTAAFDRTVARLTERGSRAEILPPRLFTLVRERRRSGRIVSTPPSAE